MTAITEMVDLEKRGNIALLLVDNPPVNALSQGVRQGLVEGLAAANEDPEVEAVVLVCKGRTFIAGADISEFGKPPTPPSLFDAINGLEGGSKPTIAAIHGTALGGGFEVALSCHYRVAVASARFGFPEVKLGLLPGAGGTQRLPRLVGPQRALEIVTSGNMFGAAEALESGLLDAVIDGDLTDGAVAFAAQVVSEKRPLKKIRDFNDKVEAARGKPEIFSEFRRKIARKSRGFMAPELNIPISDILEALDQQTSEPPNRKNNPDLSGFVFAQDLSERGGPDLGGGLVFDSTNKRFDPATSRRLDSSLARRSAACCQAI